MTLIKENFLTAADAVRSFIDWGATEIELRETVTFPEIGLEARQLHDRRDELHRVLQQAQAVADKAQIPIEIISENAPDVGLNLANIPLCHALEKRVAIAPNGDVMPCMLWGREPLGNLNLTTFEQIWNGARRLAFRDEFRRDKPPMWCPTCTVCKNDPRDEDAYYRLLAKGMPED
jgi:radical SAM protein with 4Fe4S-binding SPASM domain